MKNLFLFTFITFMHISLLSQGYKYAWITDLHVGAPGAELDLHEVVKDINKREELKFVVVTGDVTEKGRNSELELAKQILDNLKPKYFIVPGNHDTKWSESGCTKFKELWGDDKFVFDLNNYRHIGINSGIPWRGGGGHISVEDLEWLKKMLDETSIEKKIILYVHHPLDGDVDNWFKVTNLLANYNTAAILTGHGHSNRLMNFSGIPAAMGRSTLSRPKFSGYTIVDVHKDSLCLSEAIVDSIPKQWGTISTIFPNHVQVVDSVEDLTLSPHVDLLWRHNQLLTQSTSLVVHNNSIITTTTNGNVFCYNLKGDLIWQTNLGRTIFSRPCAIDNVLAVASIEGDLFTLSINDGEIIQTIGLNDALTSQLIASEVEFNGMLTKAIIAGSATGKIYCYDVNNLEFIWENNSASLMIETLPLVIQDKIIFGSWDNYLYCISKNTGSLIWKWTENKNFYYSPAACWPVTDGKNVFVTTPDKSISAIDLSIGTTTWRKSDFNAWESVGLSSDKKKVYIKSILDKFYILSADDGKLIKEIKAGFSLDTMPNQLIDWEGNIVFGSKNGNVYLINKKYEVIPLFFMGVSRVHTIKQIEANVFAASNMDGKIVVFKIKL
ncbi:MAG: PQQ-binding-like beta-propeller repeat protein [Ignavibacteriaceae bacterium]|nr:PQQ-binding-like beta-propeller repeat protein [Ignavibacteriaceae bacterium]